MEEATSCPSRSLCFNLPRFLTEATVRIAKTKWNKRKNKLLRKMSKYVLRRKLNKNSNVKRVRNYDYLFYQTDSSNYNHQ